MLPLLQLSSAQAAAHHRVAVTVHPVSKVLAGHANDTPLPALQIRVVDKIPLLHRPLAINTPVLAQVSSEGQENMPRRSLEIPCCEKWAILGLNQ